MNKTIKTVVAALTIGSSITFCTAQSSSANSNTTSKFFNEWGYSPLLGYENSPTVSYSYTQTEQIYNSVTGNYDNTTVTTTNTTNFKSYDILTFIYRARYNLTEFNNNASLSLSAIPAIGLGGPLNGNNGGLSLNIPLIVDYNIGNVATYTADQDKGFVVGVGIEYTKAPLIGGSITISSASNQGESNIVLQSGWVEPVLELGYRYWNKNNKAKEFNLKVGYGSNGAFTARLSWLKCIGY